MPLLHISAQLGYRPAQFDLAGTYLWGDSGNKDPARAFFWANRALNSKREDIYCPEYKVAKGYLILAICYRDGLNGNPDGKKCYEYCCRAVEKCPGWCYAAADCYYRGIGVEKDEERAVEMWAEQLEFYCWDALEYLQEAAKDGHLRARYACAVAQWYGSCGAAQDEAAALREFQTLADMNFTDANYMLGLAFQTGTLVTPDDAEAFRRFKLAADGGNDHAAYEVAKCYQLGLGTDVNPDESFRYMKFAADLGIGEAQHRLCLFYRDAFGVVRNEAEAFRYVKLAADQSLPDALRTLADFYETGIGTAPDAFLAEESREMADVNTWD